jgi:hypothetical protein
MGDIPRIITGIFLSLLGIILGSTFLFVKEGYFYLILGIPSLIIGIIILFNKKENKIEEIRKK